MHTIGHRHARGVFLCPGCGQIAICWADHANTTCAPCAPRNPR